MFADTLGIIERVIRYEIDEPYSNPKIRSFSILTMRAFTDRKNRWHKNNCKTDVTKTVLMVLGIYEGERERVSES